MNEARAARIESELTGSAKKVFECVPCEETWTTLQVAGELRRQGVSLDIRYIQGALNSLVDQGLIKEPQTRCYCRAKPGKTVQAERPITAAAVAVPTPTIQLVADNTQPAQAEPPQLLEKFAALAGELRLFAAKVEDLALEVETRLQTGGEADQQLKQMKNLLRAIAGLKE